MDLRADQFATDAPAIPGAITATPKLLIFPRDHRRTRQYSIHTEATYMDEVQRCILFDDKRHLQDKGAADAAGFLTQLAVNRHVAVSTQNQATSAILYLYKLLPGVGLPSPGTPFITPCGL